MLQRVCMHVRASVCVICFPIRPRQKHLDSDTSRLCPPDQTTTRHADTALSKYPLLRRENPAAERARHGPRPPPREESTENTAIVPFALPSWTRFPAAARGAVWRCVAPLGRRASLRSRNRSETCWGSPRRGSCGRLGFLRGLRARFSAFVLFIFY